MLDIRCSRRHHDGGWDLELASRIGDTLSMVAGTACYHAPPSVLGVKVSHLIVGAAQLKAEDGL